MATFYIQLSDKLQKISGDLTAANITKALGYTPSDFSGDYNDLENVPLMDDNSGELNIVDEQGNVIAKIDSEGLHSIDFIAGEHVLSNKADKDDIPSLDGYATQNFVTSQGYATQEEITNLDFYDIKNNPIVNAEEGKLIFVDESGNIGLELDKDNNLVVSDVVAGEHILSEKADKDEIPSLSGYATEQFVTDKIAEMDHSDYAKKEDLEGLATEEWVENKGYLTEHQDISNLATKDEIPSLDGYATEQWVEGKNYATKDEIPSADFNSLENNPFAEDDSGELNMTDEGGNVGFKLNEQGLYVKDVIAGDHILSNKADKSELAEKISKATADGIYQPKGNYVAAVDTEDELQDVETNTYLKYTAQNLTEAQKAQARENIGVGEGGGVTEEYVNNAIASAITTTLNTAV